MTLQYLESFDSVRSADDDGTSDEPSLTDVQAFLESLVAVALGRDIVVPQSYAFDSGSYLRVAELVLNARAEVSKESTDRPLRLHLFGQDVEGRDIDTFDAAVADMLRRTHDPGRPFHSSAHPWLSGLDDARIQAMAADLRLFYRAAPNTVARRVRLVRDEFEVADPLPRVQTTLRLHEVVAEFVDPTSELSRTTPRFEDESPGTYEALTGALRRLHTASPGSFRHRSRLRETAPWDGRTGPSALQVLDDDQAALDLVVEFVDTLYNRVVATSVGRVLGTFTTTPSTGDAAAGARLVAQNLAFGRPVPMADADADDEADPAAFDLVRVGDVRAAPDMAQEIRQVMQRGSEALRELFAARADRAVTKGRRNRFWSGIDDLEAATDRSAREDALDAHMTYLATLLQDKAELRWTKRGRVRLALTGASSGGPVLVGGPPLVSALVAGVGAIAGAATPEISNGIHHRRQRKKIVEALGTFVTITPEEGPAP